MVHLTKRTTLIILFLLLLTIGVVYTAITPSRKTTAGPTPTPIPPALQANSVLAIVDKDASGSSQKQAEVMLTTGPNKVTGVQVELTFDPSVVGNVTLSPATFFNQPTVLLNKVDATNGTISYAIAIQPTDSGKSGSGPVALISYTLLQGTNSAKNLFVFSPKTVVTAEGTLDTVLKETKGPSPLPAH